MLNHQKNHLKLFYLLPILLAFAIIPTSAFAETVMDKDPFQTGAQFDAKPLDEAEQEDEDLSALWTTCIVVVAGMLIARIVFQIVKKRMKQRSN